jgi:hypothetical protein
MRSIPVRSFCPLACLVLAGTAASVASAQPATYLRFIATEFESQPSALPTTPPTVIDALLQAKLSVSPNGQYWAAQVFNLDGVTTRRAAVSGTRTGIDWALQQTQVMPGLNEAFETSAVGIDTEVLVNNAGDVSISGNLVPATADECIVLYKRSNQTYSYVAREGSPIPGIAGESFGGGLDQRQLLADGRVVFRDGSTSGALASAVDEFIFVGGPGGAGFAPLLQGGVTSPTGLAGGASLLLTDVEPAYGFAENGSAYVSRGIVLRAAPNVVVVRNGAVVLEAGQPLPGASLPAAPNRTISTISTTGGVGPNGDWWNTGATVAGPSYLVANGQTIYTGDADFPGGDPGERVSSLVSGNFTSAGDFSFTVTTGLARTLSIVIPAGGGAPIRAFVTPLPVDFNNNGDPNDDVVFANVIFSTALGDDGTLYMIVRTALGGDIIGWLPVNLAGTPSCDDIDFNNNGVFPEDQDVVDFFEVLAGGTPATCDPVAGCNDIDFNNNGVFPEDQDVVDFFNVLAGGTCP